MAKLTKDIARVGKFLANDLKGGRVPAELKAERLQRAAEIANEMVENGLRIPAPYIKHFPSAKPAKEVPAPPSTPDELHEKVGAGLYRNLGYWDSFSFDPETGTLNGQVDVPDSLEEEAQGLHVSPLFLNPLVDGSGKDWGDAMAHVCLTNRPVIIGQSDFSSSENEEPEAIAAGFSIEVAFSELTTPKGKGKNNPNDPDTGQKGQKMKDQISALSKIIADVLGVKVELKDGATDAENLTAMLEAAKGAKKQPAKDSDKQPLGGDPDAGDPPGKVKEQPLATALGFSQEDLKSPAVQAALKRIESGNQQMEEDRKTKYRQRIAALVPGAVSPAFANSDLLPMVEAYSLSLNTDGKPQPAEIDITLKALEANASVSGNLLQPVQAFSIDGDGKLVEKELDFPQPDGELSAKEVDETADTVLSMAGQR